MAEPRSASYPKQGSRSRRTPDLPWPAQPDPPRSLAPGRGEVGVHPAALTSGEALRLPPTAREKASPHPHAHSRSHAFTPPLAPLRPGFSPPRPCPSASARANPVALKDQRRSRGRTNQSSNCPRQHPLRCPWRFGCYRVERVRGRHKGLSLCFRGLSGARLMN